ncbi:hypothetical protein GCL60_15890 [Silvanigrella paludirubra]|uniref:Organic solvent tolerance-like N-terminal domain-containing protein n=1 Tax=Silvanigrella paludirubra TaxID=2499159 RepID=A0A6N6VN71_9BACT|nr:LptA/OstA family protein [Silvanigrella paludirubra]KAB8036264.1 hypothetical protein GCL60_15890 [Silvanigrella paludirubra]
MKLYSSCKIIISLSVCLSFLQNSYADFEESLPNNFNSQSSKPTEQTDSSNTVRNKNDIDKKTKENSTKKSSGTQENSSSNEFAKHNSNAPVYFDGNTADGSLKTGILNLVGNVVLIQDDTKLTSDKAKLIGNPGKNFTSGSRSIQKAIATGNVHILKKSSPNAPEIKANADEIEFLVPKRIMILKGKAKVWKEQEFINAEYIEINLETGDISLKEPHGTIDPRSTSNMGKSNSVSKTSKDKVQK